ncbi:4-hydroxy-tetrahydrodipicolinate reductase [Candidatus Magnetominusculus xianensis]|uniref:4-hydroxy-tetrahydrodipicolinate reductase n=1 Tax=Candidatus Magnetominusculus xianensis TaxID=1748249 RepID=A0ABR5SH23_9BACT|nr:4-hydroxy-tetrahydrodipicolinate reductase [Candidatus Magnetominusculus xianensis]KWT82069.1 4-hydroxy-tetrahydrodipicolinate reductase [Candidatus Magnetominusculus xianensis]MBF0404435.1 4-hydroxy-tetrahydrodipicolinate reductase [Nitrospirota bacterium]
MLNISIAGAAGKMGQRIGVLALENPSITLVGVFERAGHEAIGVDFGEIAGVGKTGVTLTDNIAETLDTADVVIDFTSPESTLSNLRLCSEHNKAMVIGTTGMSSAQTSKVESYGTKIPVILAPNMSIGVNLLLKVLGDVARALGDSYDVEIIEAHHRLKKDAPSGTALKMANVIAEALSRNLDEVSVLCRSGIIGERRKKEIGIQTIRAGDIVGEHTVLFGGLGERIEITHKASSRDTFARGALRAALWLQDKPAGIYDMQDVLGLR